MQCVALLQLAYGIEKFQYRKRYGLHAMSSKSSPRKGLICFNTASGMDCMQFLRRPTVLEFFFVLQYRKRYGLHAIKKTNNKPYNLSSFNTASGMDCMQLKNVFMSEENIAFQYRKRYGLHAITQAWGAS